ncbi:MAG TPA: hypothetical protein VFV05_23580 [Methylomirabilota bacterium]|nr:hypothetical protein [Methylomirabilota bacterium]
MSLEQLAGLVLVIGLFVGLVAYRTRADRRLQQDDRAGQAKSSSSQGRR